MTRRRCRQPWSSCHVCCWHSANSVDEQLRGPGGVGGVLSDLKIRSWGESLGDVRLVCVVQSATTAGDGLLTFWEVHLRELMVGARLPYEFMPFVRATAATGPRLDERTKFLCLGSRK